jgi:hypothetical protein
MGGIKPSTYLVHRSFTGWARDKPVIRTDSELLPLLQLATLSLRYPYIGRVSEVMAVFQSLSICSPRANL